MKLTLRTDCKHLPKHDMLLEMAKVIPQATPYSNNETIRPNHPSKLETMFPTPRIGVNNDTEIRLKRKQIFTRLLNNSKMAKSPTKAHHQ